MITFEHVTFTYPDAAQPALADVDFAVDEGDFFLVVGETGSGKSTLLRAVNGLVPHFTGGTLLGRVTVDGISTVSPPRELADRVGVVGQNPTASFVTDTVEDELAYAMENLGIAPDVMRRRVEDVLDLLGIAALRRRTLGTLSSGEAQRVAIGSVLTSSPRVLVLDEPTSALDPGAAEDVLAILTRLVDDLGLTVLLAEHRLERVVQYASRIALVGADQRVRVGSPVEMMADAPVAPPVVALARLAGWSPMPLSVRDARRAARPLRERLALDHPADAYRRRAGRHDRATLGRRLPLRGDGGAARHRLLDRPRGDHRGHGPQRRGEVDAAPAALGAHAPDLRSRHRRRRDPALAGRRARSCARSGSCLRIRAHCCTNAPSSPSARSPTTSTSSRPAPLARRSSASKRASIRTVIPATCRRVNDSRSALAVVLAPAPPLILLDEPTRGLDYDAKARLSGILHELAASGHAVVLATHDVELVAETAARGIVIADGEIVSDGAARDVVCHSPVFAPQVAKILAPEEWLTVAEVSAALAS